jgi:hypothetical protein
MSNWNFADLYHAYNPSCFHVPKTNKRNKTKKQNKNKQKKKKKKKDILSSAPPLFRYISSIADSPLFQKKIKPINILKVFINGVCTATGKSQQEHHQTALFRAYLVLFTLILLAPVCLRLLFNPYFFLLFTHYILFNLISYLLPIYFPIYFPIFLLCFNLALYLLIWQNYYRSFFCG